MESKNTIGYFFLGLGLGVAAGVLLAPKSGAETRELIRSKTEEGGDYVRSRVEEGKDYLRERSEDLKGQASEIYKKGVNAVKAQKENVDDVVEAGKQVYRKAVKRVEAEENA